MICFVLFFFVSVNISGADTILVFDNYSRLKAAHSSNMATKYLKAPFNESKNRQKYPSKFPFEDINTTGWDFLFAALLETTNSKTLTALRASWAPQGIILWIQCHFKNLFLLLLLLYYYYCQVNPWIVFLCLGLFTFDFYLDVHKYKGRSHWIRNNLKSYLLKKIWKLCKNATIYISQCPPHLPLSL